MKEDGTSRRRALKASTSGQMPFSLVAVLLLVLSGMSAIILYQDGTEQPERMAPETVQVLKEASVQARNDISRTAYGAALDAISRMTELNPSSLQEDFLDSLSSQLNASYPGLAGGVMISVQSVDLDLDLLYTSMEDENGSSSIPAYFALSGNFSVNASVVDGRLIDVQQMDDSLYVPLPLLLDRFSRMGSSSGIRGSIEATAQYALSVLAQDRVLRGYGANFRTGATGTDAIITEEDVLRAVNIAVMLEEMKLFRTTISAYGISGDDLMGKEVDAGKLLLSTYEDDGYDLWYIAAQAINGALDRLTLGLMDAMGYLHPVNMIDEVAGKAFWVFNELVQLLTKRDLYTEYNLEDIKRWGKEAGYEEQMVILLNKHVSDKVCYIPPEDVGFYDANGVMHRMTFFGTWEYINFPTCDIFSNSLWEEHFDERSKNLRILADKIEELIGTVARLVSQYSDPGDLEYTPDPTSGKSWADELLEELRTAFEEQGDWTVPAIEDVREAGEIQDIDSLETLDFVKENWNDLTERYRAINGGAWEFAVRESWRVNGTVPMDDRSMLELQNRLWSSLACWPNPQFKALSAAFNETTSVYMEALEAALGNRTKKIGVITEAINELAGRVYGPTFQSIASGSITGVIEEVKRHFSALGERGIIDLSGEGFTLRGPGGTETREHFDVEHIPLATGNGGAGTLSIDIVKPWAWTGDDTYNPNLHLTDLTEAGVLPYTSQWSISYHGSARVSISAPAVGAGDSVPVEFELPLEGCFSVVVTTGWGLFGVDYLPTLTLDQAVAGFLTEIWKSLLSGAEALGRAIADGFDSFAQLITSMLSYSLDPLGTFTDVMMQIVASLQNMGSSFIGKVLGVLGEVGSKVAGGTEVHFSLFGFTTALYIDPGHSTIPGTEDRIRIDMKMDLAGASFSGSLHLLKMPEGDHTLVLDATLGKDDWSVQLCVDPRTRIYENVLRATGYFGGMVLEVVLPVVEMVNKLRFSLSDIPGVGQALQNIPFIPGTKLTFDAGLEIGMVMSAASSLVVNEVEMNPAGTDRGKEWVEIYNPTDRSINLDGWSLRTSHGVTSDYELPVRILAPGDYYVHTFEGQALDNGGDSKFAREESVILLDPSGNTADKGPWATDHANDGRTWQRDHDASSRWVFKEGTKGEANGLPFRTGTDLFGLMQIVSGAFSEVFRSVDIKDLQDVGELIKRAIRQAAELLINILFGALSYVKLFMEMGVADVSGAFEGRFSTALMVTGATVRDCLLSLVDNVLALLSDPLNPNNLLRMSQPFGEIGPEDIFVQCSQGLSVSVPGGVMGSMMGELCRVEARVEANMAARDMLLGNGNDDWRIDFGLQVTAGLNWLKGIGQGRGEIGVWLVHCSLRPA